MKKIVLITFLIIAAQSSLFSQKLDVRGSVGFNNTSLTNDHPENIAFRGKTGFQAQLSVSYGKMFYINPGISWRTYNMSVEYTDVKKTDKYSIGMVSLPLMVGFRIIPPDLVNIINARIYGGLRINKYTSISNGGDKYNEFELDDFRSMTSDLTVGLGIDVLSFYADLGYDFGLSPMFVHANNNVKLNSFHFNIGMRISIN